MHLFSEVTASRVHAPISPVLTRILIDIKIIIEHTLCADAFLISYVFLVHPQASQFCSTSDNISQKLQRLNSKSYHIRLPISTQPCLYLTRCGARLGAYCERDVSSTSTFNRLAKR